MNVKGQKTQSELKTTFFSSLNTNCKIPESVENSILNLNLQITNVFRSDNQQSTKIQKNLPPPPGPPSSITYAKIESSLQEIKTTKSNLITLNKEIEQSFTKLSLILKSRDSLQSNLKDFNQSTKGILLSKEKMNKLISSIDSIYKIYEQTLSIQAFLDNNSCVLKYRFLTDYEEIEKGINFFTLNSQYTDSQKYLSTYTTLKVCSINKFYSYISESIPNELTLVPDEKTMLGKLLVSIPEKNRKLYYLYKNYDKMKELIQFFEKKTKYDSDIKNNQDALKKKYIEARISKINAIYNNIFNEIYLNFNSELKTFDNINNNLFQVVLNVFIEIIHYSMLFNEDFKNDVYLLQSFTNLVFNSLYNNIRPIIVSIVSLEDLIILFDAFSQNFGIFFIEINEEDQNILTEQKEQIKHFWKILFPTDNNDFLDKDPKFFENLLNFLIISRHLIRPTILHLIQDIQEKIYFKISVHVKNNFVDIESDFPSFGSYEEKLYEKYSHFPLFHYFLKRIVIIYEIFKSKLDDKILNQIIISSIEIFISILNVEILNKKNLSYEFQIYIIQQILLCIEIVDKFQIEAVETEIEVDFNFITDMFKANYDSILSGKFTVAEVLSNSAPKILDKTKDYKKILYNNLLKSYKMFVNLSNEFIFGRDLIDLYHKIQKKDEIKKEELFKHLVEKQKEFIELLGKAKESENKILTSFEEQIKLVDTNVNEKINKVVRDNIILIKKVFLTFINEYDEKEKDQLNELKKELEKNED